MATPQELFDAIRQGDFGRVQALTDADASLAAFSHKEQIN